MMFKRSNMIGAPCEAIYKLLLKNMYHQKMQLGTSHSHCSLVDDHDEVVMYHQQTNYSLQTIEQTKVIQEVVSLEVSKLNHAVMNKKRDKTQFFPKKCIEKTKKVDELYYKVVNRFINNRFCLKMFIMKRNGEKLLELR